MANKQHEKTMSPEELKQKKAEDLEDKIIYAEAGKDGKDSNSPLANGGCGVCERLGFPIFLVRKAPVSKQYSPAQKMGSTVSLREKNREPEVEELATHQYVYRTLRVGYVYILVKHKKKGWEFLGYEVTPSGVFRHKTITDLKERNVKEIPKKCTEEGNHHIPGSFISIDTSVYEGDAYIAYTRRAWSQGKNSTIEKYLKLMNDSSITIDVPSKKEQSESEQCEHNQKTIKLETALKRFTKIELKKEAYQDPKQLTQGGKLSFSFKDLQTNNLLLELAADPNTIIHNDSETNEKGNELIENSNVFITAHKFNSLRDREVGNKDSYQNEASELTKQITRLETERRCKVPVVVIEDPFGIAEELSLQRQLKIEPIAQMIIQSEEIYMNKVNKHYQKLLDSNKRLDQKVKANINGQVLEQSSNLMDDINSNTGSKDYYSVLTSAVIPQKYFDEERLHKRKTLSLINAYRNQIVSSEMEKVRNKFYYDDIYTYHVHGENGTTRFNEQIYSPENGYEAIPMSPEEKKKHVDQKNKNSYGTSIIYNDTRKFKNTNKALQQAKEKIEKELAKYNSLLDTGEEGAFLAEEKKDYDKFVKLMAEHSQDYFYYLTWLFGFQGCSKYAPKAITEYNDCEFWLIECDTNASNNHVGYLTDFLKLIDFTCLGGVKTEEQSAIWDILLNNVDSLFYHLIDGQKDSFWELVLKKRLEIMSDELSEYDSFQPQLTNKKEDEIKQYLQQQREKEQAAQQRRIQQTKTILQELEENQGEGKLSDTYFYEKGELMLSLYTMLMSRLMAGLANYPWAQDDKNQKSKNNQDSQPEKEQSQQEKANLGEQSEKEQSQQKKAKLDEQPEATRKKVMPLMIRSNMVIYGNLTLYFLLKEVPAVQFNAMLSYFESIETSGSKTSYGDYTVTSSNQDAHFNWAMASTSADYVEMAFNIAEVATNKEILASGKTFFENIKKVINQLQAEKKIEFSVITSVFKEGAINVLNKVKSEYCDSLMSDIKNAKFKTPATIGEKATHSAKMALASFQLVVGIFQYCDNLNRLKDLSLNQSLRFEIERDLQFSFCKLTANLSGIIKDVLQVFGKSLSEIFKDTKIFKTFLSKLGNNMLKTTVAVSGALGAVTSFISILEGIFWIQKYSSRGGAIGTAYTIAGGLQIFSGVVFLMKSVGILSAIAGPGAPILLILAVVASVAVLIITTIFKDETDDWNKMQIWFNYCLFGLNKPSDKGTKYEANFDSMAMAINDYLVALSGFYAVVHLRSDGDIYYIDDMRELEQFEEIMRSVAEKGGEDAMIMMTDSPRSMFKKYCKEIFLSIGLPNYDYGVSDYEGTLRLYNYQSQEIVTLNIHNGKEYPKLEFGKDSPSDLLIKRKDPLQPVTDKELLKQSKVGIEEFYEEAVDEDGQDLGYFKIYYKAGECSFLAKKIYLQILYWPKGRKGKNSKNETVDNIPLVVYDHF
jgi:hypothetical protein